MSKMFLFEPEITRSQSTGEEIISINGRTVEVPQDLPDAERAALYSKYLGCRFIDIDEITINGQDFDLVCDDEGMFREHAVPLFFIEDEKMIIFGSILFVPRNEGKEYCRTDDETLQLLAECIHENMKKMQEFMLEMQRSRKY